MTSKASKKVSKDGRRSLKAIPVRWWVIAPSC
jgi:hypothetical protein